MNISDLKANSNFDELLVEVIDKEEPRDITTRYGKRLRVAKAKIKDETGEVSFTLWNDDIDKVQVGDKLLIKKGWVSEFRDELQISLGKEGTMEKA